MADVNRGNRPLSPHLSIYRWQMTSASSIFTRITGNGLLVGALLIVWWLTALAAGPQAFARADAVITSWFGNLVMVLSLLALWYHTLAGVRHLIWDAGHMLDVGQSEKAAYVIIAGSVVLTLLTVVLV